MTHLNLCSTLRLLALCWQTHSNVPARTIGKNCVGAVCAPRRTWFAGHCLLCASDEGYGLSGAHAELWQFTLGDLERPAQPDRQLAESPRHRKRQAKYQAVRHLRRPEPTVGAGRGPEGESLFFCWRHPAQRASTLRHMAAPSSTLMRLPCGHSANNTTALSKTKHHATWLLQHQKTSTLDTGSRG